MVEVMKLDIHASERDVPTATLEKLQEQEAKTVGKRWTRLMPAISARGLARSRGCRRRSKHWPTGSRRRHWSSRRT